MNCLALVLYLVTRLHLVLGSLPAPVNVSVSSVNFHHVLRWDPGPGTPPGSTYKITKWVSRRRWEHNSTSTAFKLKLKNEKKYYLTVRASYNQSLSPESRKVHFTPFIDTKIGPPKLSLAGCGDCIQINMSLPEAEKSSRIVDVQKFYDAEFRVSWRKREGAVESFETKNKSYTLHNLEKGVEYCVQVQTKMRSNKNAEPSAWNCTFTSIVGPSSGPAVLGSIAALLVLATGVVTTAMFSLHYTGLLCKLKAALPRPLNEVLSQGYPLTPERTIPDHIYISSQMEKQTRHKHFTMPPPSTRGSYSEEEEEEEEEDEKEEGADVYKDRGTGLSSSHSLCQSGVDVLGNRGPAASEDSGSLECDNEVHGPMGLGYDDNQAEEAEDVAEQPGYEGHVTPEAEEDTQELCQSSANVNLFSVTLVALAAREEGEEGQSARDSLTDIMGLSDREPLLNTDLTWALHHTDSQRESDMTPTMEESAVAGYEGRCANTGCLNSCDIEVEEEETEEEEDFSGYMSHS